VPATPALTMPAERSTGGALTAPLNAAPKVPVSP
jgi:hypothetical protein